MIFLIFQIHRLLLDIHKQLLFFLKKSFKVYMQETLIDSSASFIQNMNIEVFLACNISGIFINKEQQNAFIKAIIKLGEIKKINTQCFSPSLSRHPLPKGCGNATILLGRSYKTDISE